MESQKVRRFRPGKGIGLIVAFSLGLGSLGATATAETLVDLMSATESGPSGAPGNVFSITSEGIDFTVHAFAYEGHGPDASAAHLASWGEFGLGITNAREAAGNGGNYPAPQGPHSADNTGSRDAFVLKFSESIFINQATISVWSPVNAGGDADSDVSFWSGTGILNTPGDLATGMLGAGTIDVTDLLGQGTFRDVDIFTAAPVDWLIISARVGQENDGFKLRSLKFEKTVVPLPAAGWAGLSVLAVAGVLRRRFAG